MATQAEKPIVIVGAGLTGCCIAVLLSKRFPNEKIIVLESRDDYRKELAKQQAASEAALNNNDSDGKKGAFGQFDNAASRSINLALSYRGICGLQKAGLWDEVVSRQLLILMKGRMIHNIDGKITIQPYSKEHDGIYSVSRLTLNCMFLDTLDKISNVEVRFMNKLVRCDKKGVLTIKNASNNSDYTLDTRFILGCDGAYSATRNAMQRLGRYDYSIKYIPHGYKELTIYPNIITTNTNSTGNVTNEDSLSLRKDGSKNETETIGNGVGLQNGVKPHSHSTNRTQKVYSSGSNSMNTSSSDSDQTTSSPPVEIHVTSSDSNSSSSNSSSSNSASTEEKTGGILAKETVFAMPSNYLHIWPRDEFMMIGLPNPDKTFTCTLFGPWDGKNGLNALENGSKSDITEYFESNFSDFVKLCPNFYDFWINNPSSPLAHIHLNCWNYKNKILLLGDAAHAIVPFYGQGMNAGFEDCVILDELFEKYLNNSNEKDVDMIERVFNEFSRTRQPSCEALSKLSLQNYVEMRSLTGKKWFLYKKWFEGHLSKMVPSLWRPIYSMVSFSRTPYDEAMERAKNQDKYLGMFGLGLLTTATAVGGYFLARNYVTTNNRSNNNNNSGNGQNQSNFSWFRPLSNL